MIKKIFILLALFTVSIQAKEISFDEFLEKTLKNDPSFQRILLQRLYLQYGEDLAIPPSDLVLDLQGEYGFFKSYGTSTLSDRSSGSISLAKSFATTGTELKLSYSKISNLTNTSRYQSSLGLELSQAILKNSFGRASRLQKNQVELQTKIAKIQIIEAYEDYLAALLNVYLDWHQAEERKIANELVLKEEKELYKLISKKQRMGVAYPDEKSRAYVSVLNAEVELEQTKTDELNKKIKIANLMGLTISEKLVSKEVDLDKYLNVVSLDSIPRTESILTLLSKESLIAIDIANDALLPSANLFAGYEVLSSKFNLSRPDHHGYFGASFQLNFTNQKESAEKEVILLDQKDQTLSNKSVLLNLQIDLKTIENHVTSSHKLVDLYSKKFDATKKLVAQVRKKYNLGQTDLNDFVNARRDYVDARINLVEQKAINNQYLVERLRLKDQLIFKLPKN